MPGTQCHHVHCEMRCLVLVVIVVLITHSVECKVFRRCELVRELSDPRYRIAPEELATWVCIARHESEYNTSVVGHLNSDGSGDHGLFQISDLYWCSPPGVGLACGLNCDQLEDDDIKDDVVCARRIYRAHKRRTGDGFSAWAVYGPHCRGDVSQYTAGCEADEVTTTTTEQPSTESTEDSWAGTSSTTEEEPEYYEEESNSEQQEPNISEGDKLKITSKKISSRPRSNMTPKPLNSRRLSHKKPTVEKMPSQPFLLSAVKEPVYPSRSLQSNSRTAGTSSKPDQYRPTYSNGPHLDPATAWLKIHTDPRFLDEFP